MTKWKGGVAALRTAAKPRLAQSGTAQRSGPAQQAPHDEISEHHVEQQLLIRPARTPQTAGGGLIGGGAGQLVKRRVGVIHLLVDVLRIGHGKVQCVVFAAGHYSVGIARSVWIASPVSHAKPIATVVRWKRPPKDTRTATWLNAALARPKKTSIATAEPVE